MNKYIICNECNKIITGIFFETKEKKQYHEECYYELIIKKIEQILNENLSAKNKIELIKNIVA